MEHAFRATPDGVLDENCLIVPGSHRLSFLGRVLVPWKFPASKGRAWLKHSIEEMGSLENFLPDLYVREAEAAAFVLPLAGSPSSKYDVQTRPATARSDADRPVRVGSGRSKRWTSPNQQSSEARQLRFHDSSEGSR